MRKLIFTVVFSVFMMSSCIVNTAVVKPDYDFSKIKTVRVEKFSSGKVYKEASSAAQNIFIQCLLAEGYDVVSDTNIEVDAIIKGSITVFRCKREYTSFSLEDRPQYIFSNYFDDYFDNCLDLNWAQSQVIRRVVREDAVAGIYAYMTDVKTGQVVWSNSSVCKNANMNFALKGAARNILKTIPRDNISKRK
ncbi:MAG: hypothetical protein LBN01_02230 [Endomicrobium sp.]|jgi:hypothetical protein|nr:hypothetical protein [Endomicrobium sp.]